MVTAPGIEDKVTHGRGGDIERGTLEDAAVPEKEITIMTDAIVATRMTENVNLVASPESWELRVGFSCDSVFLIFLPATFIFYH